VPKSLGFKWLSQTLRELRRGKVSGKCRRGRHSCPIPLKFSDVGVARAGSLVYLFVREAVSNVGVEIGALGFGCQKLSIGVLWHIKVLVEQAGVEFDFQQAQCWQVVDRSQYRRFNGYSIQDSP
jgi:hypothetical protein